MQLRAGFLLFCLSGLLTASGCSEQGNPTELTATAETAAPAEPAIDPAKLDTAKAAIRAEAKVIDFVYDPDAVVQWTIGVKDDGSSRAGFAEYICQVVGSVGAKTDRTVVRIVDHRKYMAADGNGRDASLGTVDCRSGRHWPD